MNSITPDGDAKPPLSVKMLNGEAAVLALPAVNCTGSWVLMTGVLTTSDGESDSDVTGAPCGWNQKVHSVQAGKDTKVGNHSTREGEGRREGGTDGRRDGGKEGRREGRKERKKERGREGSIRHAHCRLTTDAP